MINNEKEMISKMTLDMVCHKYEMPCLDVPFDVFTHADGLKRSDYKCNLDCANCNEMEEI